ncbi:MAG: alcohol dehydrogenase catalytic domain-containing protein [Pseudomonadota bacterium]
MQAATYQGNATFTVVEGSKTAPNADEAAVTVGYVGICGTDMHIYHGAMDHRVEVGQVIGHEMAGKINALGADVEGFEVGDRVVVRPLDYCGVCPACKRGHSHICHNLKFMGIDSPGAMQSSWTVKTRTLHKLPDHVTLRQGALVEPLAVAVHDVSRARVAPGEDVVVLGGGPIGQLIAAVARADGARVLVSEINPQRREFAEKQGIEVFDPSAGDLVEKVMEWTGDKGADVVFEVAGVMPTVQAMTEVAAVRGRICVVAIHGEAPPVDLFKFFWRELELLGARVYTAEDFERAIELIATGAIDADAYITEEFPLDQIAEAFENLEKNTASIKSLIAVEGAME